LGENESFTTDFTGASIQDCQKWVLENSEAVNFLETNLAAFIDARSVKDGTILLTYWVPQWATKDEVPYEDEKFGILPSKGDIWYDYRIDYRQAGEALVCFIMKKPYETFYPAFFGRKDALTDENGVFDVARAVHKMVEEDPYSEEF
jgi:hypothetical protein